LEQTAGEGKGGISCHDKKKKGKVAQGARGPENQKKKQLRKKRKKFLLGKGGKKKGRLRRKSKKKQACRRARGGRKRGVKKNGAACISKKNSGSTETLKRVCAKGRVQQRGLERYKSILERENTHLAAGRFGEKTGGKEKEIGSGKKIHCRGTTRNKDPGPKRRRSKDPGHASKERTLFRAHKKNITTQWGKDAGQKKRKGGRGHSTPQNPPRQPPHQKPQKKTPPPPLLVNGFIPSLHVPNIQKTIIQQSPSPAHPPPTTTRGLSSHLASQTPL